MRCIQDPATITVTDNGNGTMTINGIHSFFATAPGWNDLDNTSGITVGSDRTSYTVPFGTYTLVTGDGSNVHHSHTITPPSETMYTVTPSAGGTISPSTPQTVSAGGSQSFSASPSSGKEVDQWLVDGSPAQSGGASFTLSNVQANTSVHVTFKDLPPPTYTVTVTGGTANPASGPTGTVVALTPDAPPAGKQFKQWNVTAGGVSVSGNTLTIGTANVSVAAVWEDIPQPMYTLTVTGGTGGGSYPQGTVVNISANAAPAGQEFDRWTGDVSGISNVNSANTTFTMGNANATVTATYRNATPPPTWTLTVNSGTGGGSYPQGTVVNISANAAPAGQEFDRWTGDVSGIANVNSANTTFTMGNAHATITATYRNATTTPTCTLTVVNGTGSGDYEAGASVSITAHAAPDGQEFDWWVTDGGGAFASAVNMATVFTMPAGNATVTATYKNKVSNEAISDHRITIHNDGSSLVVKSGVVITSVEVFNLFGQLVCRASSSGAEVLLENLPKGILMLKIALQGGGIEIRKAAN